MVSDLYEVLGLDRSASPEDIRKAYKKRALQTHPDRLPPSTTTEDKANAAEQFRLVNNAYEVLNDPNNRKLYDQNGVWPPPSVTLDPPRHGADEQWRGNSFPSSFPFGGFGHQSPSFSFPPMGGRPRFAFSDPFELFNTLFGDLNAHFSDDPFGPSSFPTQSMFNSPFGSASGSSPFGRSPFDSFFGGPVSSEPMMTSGSGVRSYSSVSASMGSGGRWVSDSKVTRTVNGRTETIHKRLDAEGNEHITYSSPDGERYTINGVEQPSHALRSSTAPATVQNGRGPQTIIAPPPQSTFYTTSQPEHAPNRGYTAPPQNGYAHSGYAPALSQPSNTAYYNRPPVNTSTYPYQAPPQQPTSMPVPVPRSPQDSRHGSSSRHHRDNHDRDRDSLDHRSQHSHHSHRGHREDERRASYPDREDDRERRSRGPATPAYEDHADKKRRWRGWLGGIGKLFKGSFKRHSIHG